MKKILSIVTFILLMFTINMAFEMNSVLANPEIDIKQELKNEIPDDLVNNQSDDALEKPIFAEDEQPQPKNKMIGTVSSFIVKIICGILIALLTIICLFFVFVANKQRQNDKRRKKMSANTNVINAVDNFARHRIKK